MVWDDGPVKKMIAVLCPACNERVEGSDSEDLSRSIRSHFADVHDVDIDVEMNISDESCGCGTESETKGTESSAGEKEFMGGEDEEAGGIYMFECPMCREDIRGSSEDERSANFREHMVTTHKDEPFITQMLEEIGTR